MKTKDIILCALFASITAIMAQISIPLIGGVPLTMQTLAVSLAGIILGAKRGFISMVIYILLGAIGLPVFASFTGGLQIIVGPTGGFLISFPIMAYIIGYISEKTKNKYYIFLGMVLGGMITLIIGAIQFSLINSLPLLKSFSACVYLFIPTTILKAILATIIGLSLKKNKAFKSINV